MVESSGLENRRRETFRGFESHPLRLRSPKRATADAVRKESAKESSLAEASYGRHRRLRADKSPQGVRQGEYSLLPGKIGVIRGLV